ncbi:Integrator complex subunit 4 [Podila horticola]|nr:Integrator complex subunit 4 [Podila horticola]
MKRAIQDPNPARGRDKQARNNSEGSSSSGIGSNTTVQPNPVLSLRPLPHNTRDEDTVMDGDEAAMDDDEQMDSEAAMDEDDEEDEESDEEHIPTVEALKALLNRLSELSNEDGLRLLEIARKKLYTESNKGAKVLLIHVVQATLEATDADGRGPVEDLLNQLQADSTEVRVQVYDTISYIVKIDKLPRQSLSDINTIRGLITTSIAGLKDRHHRIRSAVLQLISHLAPVLKVAKIPTSQSTAGPKAGYSQHDIQVIVSNYVTDPEPRVRKNALKALLDLHRQGFKLGLLMYDVAILALDDDYQEVRLHGLELIFILSGIYPNQTVQNPHGTALQALRLVDDAFVRICDAVNDSVMLVRAKACSYLGKFRSVGYSFLSQTFSKQIMARLKVDVAPKNLAAGPAQKLAQKAKLIATPEGDQDVTAQTVKLLDSGACGAFVHGLEDEFQEVRSAAIYMFMDDIDHVRLNALTSLCKIGNKAPITFDTEQLQIALGVLEDADKDVREATHRMLEVITMATQDGMTSFLESVASSMRRFSEDQLSIYQCIRAVGRRHGPFVEILVPEMLHLDKMFLPIEENVEDMLYGGHLILIFNAAIPNPIILKQLPKYAFKHYTYLRDKYPNCFPEPTEIPCHGTQPLRDLAAALTMTIVKPNTSDMDMDTASRHKGPRRAAPQSAAVSSAYETTIAAMRVQTEEDAETFYENVLHNMDRIHLLARQRGSNYRSMLRQQIAACQRDLHYITNVHAKQARAAEFASMYLNCYDLLVQIQDTCNSPSFIMMAPILSAQLFRLSYYMDHGFLGLDPTAKVSVGYFRILANLVWFFGMVQKRSGGGSSVNSSQRDIGMTKEYLQSMLQQAIKRVSDLQFQMDQPEVDQDRIQRHRAMLGDLRVAMLKAFNSPTTMEIIKLMGSIVKFDPMEIDVRHLRLQRITAEITRPTMNRDVPLEAHPTFPFMVPVEGIIRHVRDTQGVAVQVTFPGNVVRYYYPPADHFTAVEDDVDRDDDDLENEGIDDLVPSRAYRLRTSIEIFPDPAWGTGTPTDLRFTLTRAFQPDLVGHDEFICRFAEEITFQNRQQEQARLLQGGGGGSRSSGSGSNALATNLSGTASSLLSRMVTPTHSSSSGGSSSGSSLSSSQQNQSTLEISKSTTYYVSRKAPFEGLGTTL